MFERLSERLTDAFRHLSGKAVLSEENVAEAMREVRRALLDADVNYTVVKEFVAEVRGECLGEAVLRSVEPAQQAVKVVNDHLVALLGEENVPLELAASPSVILLCGLHGSGKTTTAAKLGLHLSKKLGRKPFLIGADLYRPAAMDQLCILGEQLGLPVYVDRNGKDVCAIAREGRRLATNQGCDVVIVDTAGRLQVDTDLVQELVDIKKAVNPSEILLVADAALGQEAVSVATHFNDALSITGIVLTKLDGDARGGAALSMRRVTGKPIKFAGVGERPDDFDAFYPERMAQRILGMGDVVGLVEKAAAQFEEDEAERLEEKLRRNRFDLGDFLTQMRRIRKMGGVMSLLEMLPGMGQLKGKLDVDEKQFGRIEGMICSMTQQERESPGVINTSRKRRIARGSGMQEKDVTQLLQQFSLMRKMFGSVGKKMGKGGGLAGLMGGGGLPNPAEMSSMLSEGSVPTSALPGIGGGRKGQRDTKSKKKRRNKKNRRR